MEHSGGQPERCRVGLCAVFCGERRYAQHTKTTSPIALGSAAKTLIVRSQLRLGGRCGTQVACHRWRGARTGSMPSATSPSSWMQWDGLHRECGAWPSRRICAPIHNAHNPRAEGSHAARRSAYPRDSWPCSWKCGEMRCRVRSVWAPFSPSDWPICSSSTLQSTKKANARPDERTRLSTRRHARGRRSACAHTHLSFPRPPAPPSGRRRQASSPK